MNLYDTANINPLAAGGAMVVRRMDELIGHSKLLKPLRSKGAPLEKVTNCMIAQRIDEPKSILGTIRQMKKSAAPVEFKLEMPSDRNFYRAAETLGEHSEELYQKIVDAVAKIMDLSLKETYPDWSSVISYGNKRKIGKRGYSRDHRPDLNQVKLGVCLAGKIPFYYSLDEGNVPDITQFKRDLERINERLPKRSLLIYDKGGNSKDLRKVVKDEYGFDYLTILKDTSSTREIVESGGRMELVKEYKSGEKVYGKLVKRNNEYCYVYMDERRAEQECRARERKAKKILEERRELEEKVMKRKRLRDKKVVKTPLGDKVIITETVIQQRLASKSDEEIERGIVGDSSFNGYFVLVSSRKMGLKRALSRYRRRDDVEKLIDALKNVYDIKPMRVWTDDSIKGVIFICMLAALFTAVVQLLTKTKKRAGSIMEEIRNLTLLVKVGKNGRILEKKLAGLSEIIRDFLTSPI